MKRRLLGLAVAAVLLVQGGGPAFAAARCDGVEGYAKAFGGRRTFFLKPDQLTALKTRRDRDPEVAKAYRQLIAEADRALLAKPYTVTAKTRLPPSGDRHDYMSMGPYWWPDPARPDGLPYIRRDGEMNPERATAAFDRTAIGAMSRDVATLGLAYFYSDDRRYAAKAAALVRAWFLAPATAMNPNANFAQGVPGRLDGRPEGVLDTNAFQAVIDAVGLIAPSGAWSKQDGAGLERWFGRYVDWMQTSANGRGERDAKNNHALWYDAQLAQYALYARRPAVAKAVVTDFPKRRIEPQVAPDGSLPAEIARTRSFHYSVYALIAAYDVAEIATCVGTDLWSWQDAQGRGLRRATDFLARYRDRPKEWPHPELEWPKAEFDDLLVRARWAWGANAYPPVRSTYPLSLHYLSP